MITENLLYIAKDKILLLLKHVSFYKYLSIISIIINIILLILIIFK